MKKILIALLMVAAMGPLLAQSVAITSKMVQVTHSGGREIYPLREFIITLKVSTDTSFTITRVGGPYKPIVEDIALSALTMAATDTTDALKITALQALGATWQTSATYRTIIPKSQLWGWDYTTSTKRVTCYLVDGRKILRKFTVHIDSLKNDSSTTARLVYLNSTFYP